jgi:hypothetical protein
VDDVNVLGALIFEGLQNIYLTKELFEGVVSILRILLIVLPVCFDDLYRADLLGFAVFAERTLAILLGDSFKRGVYLLKTLPYEPFPINSRNS